MRHIPNAITTLNLVSGFIAIIFVINGNHAMACWMVAAAMIFDFLDGFASRLLNAYSDMGKELDSIADVVSFGVAPGLIIYQLLSGKIAQPENIPSSETDAVKIFFLLVSSLYPACAGLRLARFNIDPSQSVTFRGLPAPAAALAVISVVFAYLYSDNFIVKYFTESKTSLTLFTLIISFLMVSRLPMLTIKIKNIRFRGNEARYFLAVLTILFFIIFGFAGLTLIIPAYIVVSLVLALV